MAQDSALDILRKYQGQTATGQQRDTATINAQLRSRAGLPEQSSFIGDVLLRQGLGQGVLMGAGDEAEAYARSLARGTRYEDELAAIRQQMSVTRAERPIASTAAEIVGGLAPAAALTVGTAGIAAPAAAARTASLASQIGRLGAAGTLAGTAQGGIEGFAKSEAQTAQGRLDKAAEEAIQGGIFGGAVGAAFPAVAGAVRAVGRTPEELASGIMQRTLQQEGLTGEELLRRYQARQATGVKPEIPAEVLPPGSAIEAQSRLVAQGAGAERGAISEAMQQRAAGQPTRLAQEFESAIGPQKNVFASLDDLAMAREQMARPLYQKVDPMVARSDEIDELIKKVPQNIFNEIESVASITGVNPAGIISRGANNQKTIARDYTFAEVDSIQKALDDAAASAFAGNKGNLGSQLKGLRDDLVSAAENRSPDYKKAREIWAGSRAAERQIKEGQSIFKMRPEQIERNVAKMSQADKDAYLVGVFDAFSNVLNGRVVGEDVTRAFRTGRAKEQMQAAIKAAWNDPTEAKRVTDQLFTNIEREARMMSSRNKILGGSQTAQTLLQQEANVSAMSPIAALASDLATGGPALGAFGRLAQNVGQAYQKGATAGKREATNEALRRVLFAQDAPTLQRELKKMEDLMKQRGYQAPTGARAFVPGLLGADISGALGQ